MRLKMNKMITLYECISGSKAYGLATETSDDDFRGVITPNDFSYFFGLDRFDILQTPKTIIDDIEFLSLQKFVSLAFKCNTVPLELLYSPEENVRACNPLFKKYFLENRSIFLSTQIYNTIRGYSFGEFKQCLAISSRDLGEKRKLSIEKYGYSVKMLLIVFDYYIVELNR